MACIPSWKKSILILISLLLSTFWIYNINLINGLWFFFYDFTGTHHFEKLRSHILKLSAATNFDEAKEEWSLYRVRITHDFGRCPCGVAIKEHCHLENSKNKNRTWVGNVCVKNFIGIDSGSLFSGLRRLKSNTLSKPNTAVIEYARKAGYLFGQNEYEYLMQIKSKRRLSEKQQHWLQKINRRILENIIVNRVPDQTEAEE